MGVFTSIIWLYDTVLVLCLTRFPFLFFFFYFLWLSISLSISTDFFTTAIIFRLHHSLCFIVFFVLLCLFYCVLICSNLFYLLYLCFLPISVTVFSFVLAILAKTCISNLAKYIRHATQQQTFVRHVGWGCEYELVVRVLCRNEGDRVGAKCPAQESLLLTWARVQLLLKLLGKWKKDPLFRLYSRLYS